MDVRPLKPLVVHALGTWGAVILVAWLWWGFRSWEPVAFVATVGAYLAIRAYMNWRWPQVRCPAKVQWMLLAVVALTLIIDAWIRLNAVAALWVALAEIGCVLLALALWFGLMRRANRPSKA